VVDDDPNVLEVLNARLTSAGFNVIMADGGQKALRLMESRQIDFIISDMKMPNMGGMDFFSEARLINPAIPVLFLTAYGTIPDAVRAVKAGAVDYLVKPFDGRELVQKLKGIIAQTAHHSSAEGGPATDGSFSMATKSPVMRDLYDLVKKVAASNVNILILGESGVGKEYIARGIHRISPRRHSPFVVVDCGSTPTGLLESELFGHVKGSFTHAIRDKKGLIKEADTGTLFLDEIGNVSAEMQTRLLRFLEDYKIRRIGDLSETKVDCRVISATNTNLLEDIETDKFREDLYYRLRVVTLNIPPLRERQEDIPVLAHYFVTRFSEKNHIPPVKIPPETMQWLCEYPWPGNIRELKNALEAGAVLCQDGVLTRKDLHLTGLPEISRDTSSSKETLSLEENERNTIVLALKEARGVQKKAADLLGISRRAIHYKIKKYGIDVAGIQ
jgi:DNA-binding NtrC family response regulator